MQKNWLVHPWLMISLFLQAPDHCLGAPVLPPQEEILTRRNTTGSQIMEHRRTQSDKERLKTCSSASICSLTEFLCEVRKYSKNEVFRSRNMEGRSRRRRNVRHAPAQASIVSPISCAMFHIALYHCSSSSVRQVLGPWNNGGCSNIKKHMRQFPEHTNGFTDLLREVSGCIVPLSNPPEGYPS